VIRQAIKAPEGMTLVACDSAQIEARVGAFVTGERDLLNIFKRGGDPYIHMAAVIEGTTDDVIRNGMSNPSTSEKYRTMRSVGKVTMLSSQYGIGPDKLALYFTRAGLTLGKTESEHDERAREIHKLYNNAHPAIRDYRTYCHRALGRLVDMNPGELVKMRPFMRLAKTSDRTGLVQMPSGFTLVYPELRRVDGEFVYDHWNGPRKSERRIYGGQLFNNIVQSLSFNILWLQGVRINERYPVVSNVHDSWMIMVDADMAVIGEAAQFMHDVMRDPQCDWARDLPLRAEATSASTYIIA
jgi:DNA polymerase